MRTTIKEVITLLSYIKRGKSIYWISMICGIVADGVLSILIALFSRGIINAVEFNDMDILKNYSMLGVAIIIIAILMPIARYVNIKTVRNVMFDLKTSFFEHIINLDITYFEKNHTGDSMVRLTTDTDRLKEPYFNYIFWLAKTFLSGMAAMVMMLLIDIRISLVMIVVAIISVYANIVFAKRIRDISNNIQKEKSLFVQSLGDIIAGLKVIKLYNNSSIIINKNLKQNSKISDLSIKRARKMAELASVSYVFSFTCSIVVMVTGVLMSANGLIDFGSVAAIIVLQSRVTEMFSSLGIHWGLLVQSMVSGARVFEIYDKQKEVSRFDLGTRNDDLDSSNVIQFCNVNFAYGEKIVLKSFNLGVKEGSITALSGASGCGKSTVMKLLLGFYPIESGQIYINGKPYSDLTLKELRNLYSYVSQDAYLFDGTIKENISYGKIDSTEDEILNAARLANAHDFIMDLPDGYNTHVGERGEKLSGGQRQRVAIARAFMRNANILLLDEATSALDSKSEAEVQKGLRELMKGRTTLVVAHKKETIDSADYIYQMM